MRGREEEWRGGARRVCGVDVECPERTEEWTRGGRVVCVVGQWELVLVAKVWMWI